MSANQYGAIRFWEYIAECLNEAKKPDVSLMYFTNRSGIKAKIFARAGEKNEIKTISAPLIKSSDKIGNTKIFANGEIREKDPK